MSLYLLDTDTLSLWQYGHLLVCQRVEAQQEGEVHISDITIQEQMDGWRSCLSRARAARDVALAYEIVAKLIVPAIRRFPMLSFTEPAVLRFEQLVSLRLNGGGWTCALRPSPWRTLPWS